MNTVDVFQPTYEKLVAIVKNQTLNPATSIIFITHAMQLVEQLKSLSGPEKKQLVIELMVKLIRESPLSDDVKALLYALPYASIIDSIIAASKNQLKINEVVSEIKTGKACGCFGGK